ARPDHRRDARRARSHPPAPARRRCPASDARRAAVDPALPAHADLGHAAGHQRRAVAERHPRASFRADRQRPTSRIHRTMTIYRFAFPTTIHFGAGARTLVAEHLGAHGLERPLIVTDRGIAPLPMLKKLVADLHRLEVGVYSEIWGNPVKTQVENGV